MTTERTLEDAIADVAMEHDGKGRRAVAEIAAAVRVCVPADAVGCNDDDMCPTCVAAQARNATLAEVRANIERYVGGK